MVGIQEILMLLGVISVIAYSLFGFFRVKRQVKVAGAGTASGAPQPRKPKLKVQSLSEKDQMSMETIEALKAGKEDGSIAVAESKSTPLNQQMRIDKVIQMIEINVQYIQFERTCLLNRSPLVNTFKSKRQFNSQQVLESVRYVCVLIFLKRYK